MQQANVFVHIRWWFWVNLCHAIEKYLSFFFEVLLLNKALLILWFVYSCYFKVLNMFVVSLRQIGAINSQVLKNGRYIYM